MDVMKFIEKALAEARRQHLTERELWGAAGVEHTRGPRFKDGRATIFLSHAVGIARRLGVSLDYLCADESDNRALPITVQALDDDSRAVLRVVQALGLSADEAIRRLSVPPPELYGLGVHTIGGAARKEDVIGRGRDGRPDRKEKNSEAKS